jgi:DNA primase
MKKDFKNDFRDEVKANTDIVQIIERYSTLDLDGETKWKKGECPICGEGTILVEPEAQIFKTICCKHQGDCFTFIELMLNKSYTEALIHLAEEAEMQIPKRLKTNGHSDMNDKPRRRMFGFFKRSIPYFKDLRKLTGSVTASFSCHA